MSETEETMDPTLIRCAGCGRDMRGVWNVIANAMPDDTVIWCGACKAVAMEKAGAAALAGGDVEAAFRNALHELRARRAS